MQISVYAALNPSSKVAAVSWRRSVRFALASDLALDLFSEFQGMLDFFEYFRRTAGAAHDYRSVSQDSSHGRLVDDDAFDSGEEDFGGPAFRKAGFYDDSFVGDGHLRDAA